MFFNEVSNRLGIIVRLKFSGTSLVIRIRVTILPEIGHLRGKIGEIKLEMLMGVLN